MTELSTALPSAWVEKLFLRFGAIYGNKFAEMWKGQDLADVRRTWAQEMTGYSGDELRAGLESLRAKHPSWPPSLYEFTDLCRPVTKTDHEGAFYEAVRGTEARRQGKPGTWSNKAVYWAAIDVSAFDMLGSTWPQLRSRWTRAYDERLRDPNLPVIPEVAAQLPAPKSERADNAAVDSLSARLKATTKRDPLGWARRLLERHEAGDKTVDPYALKMARDAPRIAAGGRP